MNSSQLAGNTLWVMAPEWLSHREEESKSIVITERIPEEWLTEMTMKKRENLKSSTLLVNTKESRQQQNKLFDIVTDLRVCISPNSKNIL